jgi:hypothetical protein
MQTKDEDKGRAGLTLLEGLELLAPLDCAQDAVEEGEGAQDPVRDDLPVAEGPCERNNNNKK